MTELRERWLAAWPEALAAWGQYVRLRPPVLHDKAPRGVASFAWFSTVDVEVGIDMVQVERDGLQDMAVPVLAHEIGHHVLSPADLGTSARIIARVQAGLIDRDDDAGMIANLWSDLLINDRLQRRAGLRMDLVYKQVVKDPSGLFAMVMRADELLWQLPLGSLSGQPAGGPLEADAQLCAALVRVYASDPVGGAGGFAALCRPHLPDRKTKEGKGLRHVVCGQDLPDGTPLPGGLVDDPRLSAPVVHPALDPSINSDLSPDPAEPAVEQSAGQAFGPADLAAVLKALGASGGAEAAAAAYYRDAAAKHLIRFPTSPPVPSTELQLEGLDLWEGSDDLAALDWNASLVRSPIVIPGVTTVQRAYGLEGGDDGKRVPLDLDLYVDSSGSMPDPRSRVSPLALAGAVLALSAIRSGARAQVTTWSGPSQVVGTDGFSDSPDEVLRALVAFFGGGTTFPLPLLARTHLEAKRTRPCHIAVISDSGVTSMFGEGQPAALDGTAFRALDAAGGGGSLILQLPEAWQAGIEEVAGDYEIHRVDTLEDLVAFAQAFARRTWGVRR